MRGGKRRGGGGGFVPWGGWRGQSRGEGVNRRRRQASFLIKTDHSHQPYQNLVACLHKTTNKNRLLAWPYIRSRPHLSRDYDRLHTAKWGGGWERGGGEGNRKGHQCMTMLVMEHGLSHWDVKRKVHCPAPLAKTSLCCPVWNLHPVVTVEDCSFPYKYLIEQDFTGS